MKAIQGIMLLTIMLAVSCTKEPGTEGVPVPPTAEENFVNAINEKFVWDSDGTELTAGIDENKVGTLSVDDYVTYSFSSLKTDSTTQAIYEAPYGGGFIGVELFDDNKQAIMYKKGAVEAWTSAGEVSFDLEHKMESSAKGEWIATAQFKTVRIDKIGYAMMSDGNIYLINEANPLGLLTFKHVSHPSVVARGTDDGKHRDRAIYKKADADEFLGLLANDTEHLSVYKDAMINYWITEDLVSFDDAHKFFSFADDVFGKKVWNSTGDELTAGYDENGDSVLGHTVDSVFTSLYFYESLVTDSRTRAYYTNALGKFIGVEYDPAFVPSTEGVAKDYRALVMYKKDLIDVWATKEDVKFEDAHKLLSSSKGDWIKISKDLITKISGVVYTMKADGNLYDSGDALAFTYVVNYKPTPVTRTPNDEFDRYKAIYKKSDNEFFGLSVEVSAGSVTLYTTAYYSGGSTFWTSADLVNFSIGNIVPKTPEELFVENIYEEFVLDANEIEYFMNIDSITGKGTIINNVTKDIIYNFDSVRPSSGSPEDKMIYQAIYTYANNASQYIGIQLTVSSVGVKAVGMYKFNGGVTGQEPWASADAVEFAGIHATAAGWEVVGDILTANGNTHYETCFPSITIDDSGNLYAAFRNRSAGQKVGVIKYTPGAEPNTGTWASLGGPSISTEGTSMTDIVVDSSGNVFASYSATSYRTGILKYDFGASVWKNFGENDTEFFSYGKSKGFLDPAMLINIEDDGEYIYAVSPFNRKIVVKKRKTDGSDTWALVGTDPFNEIRGKWSSSSLVIDPTTGYPVVGIGGQYNAVGQNQTIRIAKFDGTEWIELGDSTVGVAGAGKGASGHNMAINKSGEIYVAYTDGNVPYGGKYAHSVKKWEDGAWVLVGEAGFTKNRGDFIKILFYSDGTPVVTIGGSGNIKTVVKGYYYDRISRSWKNLGAKQVSDNTHDFYSDSVIDTRNDMFYTIYSALDPYGQLTVKSRAR